MFLELNSVREQLPMVRDISGRAFIEKLLIFKLQCAKFVNESGFSVLYAFE